jgi:chemotaxis protein MotB
MVMKFRRLRTIPVNHERWLVSYADFVTLLFAFFVVLYASAQVDRQRAMQLSDAIRAGFRQLGVFENESSRVSSHDPSIPLTALNPSDPLAAAGSTDRNNGNAARADLSQLRSELEKALAVQIDRKEAALHMERDGLVVTLREIGFFDSGSADMKPSAKAAFVRVAAILRAHSCAVRIEGHTDNVPIHTSQFASNWELSTARASRLVRSLIETYGISPALLSAAGYAEFRPTADNNTSQGRALNRRVDLVILNARPNTELARENPHGSTGSSVNQVPVPNSPETNPLRLAQQLAGFRSQP